MLSIQFQNDWGQSPEDVAVSVFDGYGDVILDRQQGTYQVEVDVSDGLYTVRVETAGGMREQSVRVKNDTDVTVRLPDLYSPTPLSGAATTHEYYTGPTYQLTAADNNFTSDAIGAPVPDNGELVIMIRASNEKVAPRGDLADGLVLTDLSGNPLRKIGLNNCMRLEQGFQGFRAPIEPGIYCLIYPKHPRRALLLQAFSGRQTQVFTTYWHRPLIEEASIFLPPAGEAFEPFDNENRAMDLAIRGLVNNEDWLPKETMRTLLDGKFRNPMLGLLGAFIIIHRKKPNIRLLDIVLGNLNNLLPQSVDVQVLLRLFAMATQGAALPATPEPTLRAPPILRAAMESAIHISWEDPDYLTPGSMAERVSLDLYTDSAWTSWRPPEEWGSQAPLFKAAFHPTDIATAAAPDWVVQTLWQHVKVARERQRHVEATAIAQQMGLPGATVAAILKNHSDEFLVR